MRLEDARTVPEVEEAFRASLSESEERERGMGVTVVGPHRDDLRLRLQGTRAGLDIRTYGSGGQRRTAALALRLVEARTIRARRGAEPLLLLDEGRSERVLALLDSGDVGQVLLTAPKSSDVRLRKDALPRWRIRAGRIEP